MKHRFSLQSTEELRTAIINNDLSKIQELIEQGKAGITNLECMLAVQHNQLDVLKYFLENVSNAIEVLAYGLYVAVYDKNLDAINIIAHCFRNNKEHFPNQDLDSVIVKAIKYVTELSEENYFTGAEAMELIKYIMSCYYD